MTDLARLESLAQQLAARIRDDDPDANLRWLRAELGIDMAAPVTDEERLLFVLAAAVPDDRRWRELVDWADRLPASAQSSVLGSRFRRHRRLAGADDAAA